MHNIISKVLLILLLCCVSCSDRQDSRNTFEPVKNNKQEISDSVTTGKLSTPKYGGTVVLSTSSDPKSFNPIIAKETSTTAVTGFIFEGLTETDGVSLEVKPALARKWEISKDGKEWTFFLRRNVRWHDGVEFTADDVVFTFEKLIYNTDIPTSSRDIFLINGKPVEVRKINKYTIKFVLPDRFAPFLRLLSQEILPKHKLAATVEQDVFTSTWGVNTKPTDIVGTGPFALKEYRQGEWIILDRNPDYWKKSSCGKNLPYIDRIALLVIADHNMAILKFLAGEIDSVSLRGQDYALLKPREKKENFRIYDLGPSLGSEFLTFNQNIDAPAPENTIRWFRKQKFRQAIAHSLDKKSIIKNVLGGFGYPQNGPMNVSSGYFYNPHVNKYTYDINRAKELLVEAGFKWKKDSLYDENGNRVEFTILTNSNNPERIQIASIIQDDIKKLGIKANLLPIEFNTLVTKISVTKDWEAVIIALTGGIEPHGGKNVWHSTGQLHLWNLGEGIKLTPWEKELNSLFEAGEKELNRQKRKKIYDKWQEVVSIELPLIYTVNSTVLYAVKNKFGNLQPTVYGGIFHNIDRIYMEPYGQSP